MQFTRTSQTPTGISVLLSLAQGSAWFHLCPMVAFKATIGPGQVIVSSVYDVSVSNIIYASVWFHLCPRPGHRV